MSGVFADRERRQEVSGQIVHVEFRRRMKNIRRDEVDYLPEDRVYCLRCFWWCLFLHNPVGYRITPPVATLNIHPFANAVSEWDANGPIQNSRS